MIRTVLADHEVLARQKLRHLLSGNEDVDVVGECTSAREILELVQLTAPDLLFLDVQMPEMDGFEVVDALRPNPNGRRPQVIFITGNDKFAARAFDIHAIDYLIKPFTIERLQAALHRARERLACGNGGSNGHSAISESDRYTTRMVFKSRGRILFLPVTDIRWIAAEENYVRICTATESHLLRETIGRLENRLDPQVFLRVHRSSIVNLHYVKEVKHEPDGDATVVLMGGEKIAMSRSYRSRIQKLMTV